MKEVTIKRSKWARGGRDTKLVNSDGTMCCLGFVCNAYKVPKYVMDTEKPSYVQHPRVPAALLVKYGGWDSWDSLLSEEAIMLNDNELITSKTRERKLTSLFKKVGIKLKFVP